MSILTIDKKTIDDSISNYETLKKTKLAYENINSILKYSNIRMDTETANQLKNAIDILEYLYGAAYSTIEKDSKEHIDLYLCKKCDENFYDFEVPDEVWYLKNDNKYNLNSEKIQKVDRNVISEYISCWDEGKPLPVDKDMIYTQDGSLFIAIDNTNNECYVEEFDTEEEVLNWFNEFENEDDMEMQ